MGEHDEKGTVTGMALPKYEDWLTSWLSKNPEFDAEKAQKHIYNLEVDKDNLSTSKAALATERDAAVTKRDELQGQVDAKAREGESAEQRAQRLEQELAAERAKPAAGSVTPEIRQLRLEAAMSVSDDITAKGALALAGFIQGVTKEDAEASAKQFVENFGIPGAKKAVEAPKDDEDDDSDDQEQQDVNNLLRQQPSTTSRPRSPLDNSTEGGVKPVSELLTQIPRL